MNQLEADNLKQLNVYGDVKKTNILIKEYIDGRDVNFTTDEENILNDIKDKFDFETRNRR